MTVHRFLHSFRCSFQVLAGFGWCCCYLSACNGFRICVDLAWASLCEREEHCLGQHCLLGRLRDSRTTSLSYRESALRLACMSCAASSWFGSPFPLMLATSLKGLGFLCFKPDGVPSIKQGKTEFVRNQASTFGRRGFLAPPCWEALLYLGSIHQISAVTKPGPP